MYALVHVCTYCTYQNRLRVKNNVTFYIQIHLSVFKLYPINSVLKEASTTTSTGASALHQQGVVSKILKTYILTINLQCNMMKSIVAL